ncbi:MAG: hypothetical protein ACI364_06475 [Coriobacteriales bacterium]
MKARKSDINENGSCARRKITCCIDERTHDRAIICTRTPQASRSLPKKEVGKHKHDSVIVFDWSCRGCDARKKFELAAHLRRRQRDRTHSRGRVWPRIPSLEEHGFRHPPS